MKIISKYINTTFLFILLCEAFLMGSGQMLHVFGSLTLKMTLFIIAMLFAFIKFCDNPIRHEGNTIVVFAFIAFFIGTLMHFLYSFENINLIFYDLKTVSYVFICLYFAVAIRAKKTVSLFIKIFKISCLLMSVIYLIYLYLILVRHYLDFNVLYSLYAEGMDTKWSDFAFRGQLGFLFYKGFVFLPMGFIFYLSERKYIQAGVVLVAILMTLTRGFYVMTFAAIILYYFFSLKRTSNKILMIVLLSVIIVAVIVYAGFFSGAERMEGDKIRLETFRQVFERITPLSFFVGHGFGNGVPIREMHMENSFLEIFHKQGIIGLAFWAYLFIIIRNKFKSIRKKDNKRTALLLYIGVIVIYLQTNFNPFLNCPIGLSFVLMSYFSLWVMHKEEYKEKIAELL